MTATLSTDDIVLRSFAAVGIHQRLACTSRNAPIVRSIAAVTTIVGAGLIALLGAFLPDSERIGTVGISVGLATLALGILAAYRFVRPGHIALRASATVILAYGIFVVMDWNQLKLIQAGPDGWDLWETGAGVEIMYSHQHPTLILFGYCLFFAALSVIVIDSALRLAARQRLRAALIARCEQLNMSQG